MYGKELVLDLHGCDISKFNRADIKKFCDGLCEVIDMEQRELYFWEDETLVEPHTKGISAVQFIVTSNITIHTLEILKAVYLNVFSCKDFDADVARRFCVQFFAAKGVSARTIIRG